MAEQCQKPLKLDVASMGPAKVLTISGSASMGEADKIRKVLVEMADEGTPIIALDLSNMDFIGSAGLGTLIVGHLHASRHHGQIRLVKPSPEVLGVLQTTNLTRIFPVYATVDEAVNAGSDTKPSV